MEEGAPALLVHSFHFFRFSLFFAVNDDLRFFFFGVHQAFGVQGGLGEKAICRRDTQDSAHRGGYTEKYDVPGESTWLLGPITIYGTDYATDFMVEEEENGDN